MPKNEDIANRIIAAIKAKSGDRDPACGVCGHHDWRVPHEYAPIAASRSSLTYPWPIERYFPTIPLICTTCGNTLFINVRLLGLADVQNELVFDEEK